MKSLKDTLLESREDTRWIAIEVTTEDSRGKMSTSSRVVTVDNYEKIYDEGRTKGGRVIVDIQELGPASRNREVAMSYLPVKEKTRRKSKIDKKGANYIVYGIAIGKLSGSGKTKFGWNFWENCAESARYGETLTLFVDEYGRRFWYGVADSLKIGDTFVTVDNDSLKIIDLGRVGKIAKIIPCPSKEEFVKNYREAFPDLCSQPKKSFGREIDGIPWSRFEQVYSIKGVAEELEV